MASQLLRHRMYENSSGPGQIACNETGEFGSAASTYDLQALMAGIVAGDCLSAQVDNGVGVGGSGPGGEEALAYGAFSLCTSSPDRPNPAHRPQNFFSLGPGSLPSLPTTATSSGLDDTLYPPLELLYRRQRHASNGSSSPSPPPSTSMISEEPQLDSSLPMSFGVAKSVMLATTAASVVSSASSSSNQENNLATGDMFTTCPSTSPASIGQPRDVYSANSINQSQSSRCPAGSGVSGIKRSGTRRYLNHSSSPPQTVATHLGAHCLDSLSHNQQQKIFQNPLQAINALQMLQNIIAVAQPGGSLPVPAAAAAAVAATATRLNHCLPLNSFAPGPGDLSGSRQDSNQLESTISPSSSSPSITTSNLPADSITSWANNGLVSGSRLMGQDEKTNPGLHVALTPIGIPTRAVEAMTTKQNNLDEALLQTGGPNVAAVAAMMMTMMMSSSAPGLVTGNAFSAISTHNTAETRAPTISSDSSTCKTPNSGSFLPDCGTVISHGGLGSSTSPIGLPSLGAGSSCLPMMINTFLRGNSKPQSYSFGFDSAQADTIRIGAPGLFTSRSSDESAPVLNGGLTSSVTS
ncbi:unnamed protein product, partial [Protopolystoma xenopodis]